MDRQIYILVVEDELEVMEALVNDLEQFEEFFPIESANSSEEAKQVVKDVYAAGNEIGLVLCDHVMPGQNGVDFLIELQANNAQHEAKKVLVTGQAGLEDTIQAINNAKLDYYIAKPWTKEQLEEVVTTQLTNYIMERKYNPMQYMMILDSVRLSEYMRTHKITDH
ncbi:MAG: response regulator [Balneolaceae bacterium]|nr:response regulator [Balneolaceae bacterium]